MNTDVMFSSKTSEWGTPRDLFDDLNKIFHFTLDAAATSENALCEKYYTATTNGLAHSWKGEIVFVNPPYGRRYNKIWSEKIASEGSRTVVVALLPARTGSGWFQDNIASTANYILFFRGRLKFSGSTIGAPFDSCVAIWIPESKELCKCIFLRQSLCYPISYDIIMEAILDYGNEIT